ncbi:MAG: WG repeat-containing protein [Oscillospiraceae bacterium]|jgi:hypothetical protein|nr:WG repeat-containing protein [Oscillospiraceae bacterium]
MSGIKKLFSVILIVCLFTGTGAQFAVYAHVVNNPWIRNTLEDDFSEDSPFLNAEDRFVEAVPFVYDHVWGFHEGYATIVQGENEGVADRYGNVIVTPQFAMVTIFSEGLALARAHSGEIYFLDSAGDAFLLAGYDDANLFSEGLAPVSRGGRWGYINKDGNEVIPLIYDSADVFAEGLAAVQLNGKWGFINTRGDETVPFVYDDALSFNEGAVWVRQGEYWGLIDNSGNELIEFKYERIIPFSEGLAAVQLRGRWGYIDRQGNEIIPFIYEMAYRFNEGLAPVGINDKWGFIDYEGRLVVPFEFENISSSSGGLIVVEENMIFNVIDRFGNVLLSGYDIILGFNEGMAPAFTNGRWGFVRDIAYNPDLPPQSWEDVVTPAPSQAQNNNSENDLWSRLGPFLAGIAVTFIAGTMIIIPMKRYAARKQKQKKKK